MPTTRARPAPLPADPPRELVSVAELKARLQESNSTLAARLTEQKQSNDAPRSGQSPEQRDARIARTLALAEEIKQAEEEILELKGQIKRAERAEEEARAVRDAASADDDLPPLVQDCLGLEGQLHSAVARLERKVSRYFDPAVQRRLTRDPTLGHRAAILRLCPTLWRLAELEREGRSLVPAEPPAPVDEGLVALQKRYGRSAPAGVEP
jgi:uncharacterized protein YhaN